MAALSVAVLMHYEKDKLSKRRAYFLHIYTNRAYCILNFFFNVVTYYIVKG